MSAEVRTEYIHLGVCPECGTASAPCDSEYDAEEWTANHNAEHHETDNSGDEDYERFKEARDGD